MSEEKEDKAIDSSDVKKSGDKNTTQTEKPLSKLNHETVRKHITASNTRTANKLFLSISIVFIIAAVVAFLFLNTRLNKLEVSVQKSRNKSSQVEQRIAASMESKLKRVMADLNSYEEKINKLEDKQKVLTHAFSQPVKQQINVNKEYALIEIEHLLTIADYHLKLEHNITRALFAMETAKARLSIFDDPAMLSANRQLSADINKLRSSNQVDLGGIAFYLSNLITTVDSLVLREGVVIGKKLKKVEQQQSSEEPIDSPPSFFSAFWQELKSLVIISRKNDMKASYLLPEQVDLLKTNLKFELVNARFAVLNRDTANFHLSLAHIQSGLEHYFDLSNSNVRNSYEALADIKKTDLSFPDVDISSSLESVRALSHTQEYRTE